jgi:hypothetical protein
MLGEFDFLAAEGCEREILDLEVRAGLVLSGSHGEFA